MYILVIFTTLWEIESEVVGIVASLPFYSGSHDDAAAHQVRE